MAMNHNSMDHMNHMNHSMRMTTTMDPHAHHNMNSNMDMGGHAGHNMGMNMNGTCDMPGMMMYFHTGSCEYILLEVLKVSTPTHMGIACLVFFILSMMYEGLKFLREYLLRQANVTVQYSPASTTVHNSSQEVIINDNKSGISGQMLTCSHLLQTVLHMVQVFVSYCLMLVFMTYNVWLCLAIILGAGAGYFLFGWKRAVVVDINEHCH